MKLQEKTKRGFLFLETNEFDKADSFFESALNDNSEDSYAYIGKLLVDLQLSKIDDLNNLYKHFNNNRNYELAYRFANDELKNELDLYVKNVDKNIQNHLEQEKEKEYLELSDMLKEATCKEEYLIILDSLNNFDLNYKDVSTMIETCNNSILEIDYEDALVLEKKAKEYKSEEDYNIAIELFNSLKDYKDSKGKANSLKKELDEYHISETQKRERNKKKKRIIISIFALIIVTIIITTYFYNKSVKYNNAMEIYSNEDYATAAAEFLNLGSFKDSDELYVQCQDIIMEQVNSLIDEHKYLEALETIQQITYDNYFEKVNSIKDDIVSKILKEDDYASISKILNDSNTYNATNIVKNKISDNQKKGYSEYIKNNYEIGYSSSGKFRDSTRDQLKYLDYIDYSDTYTQNLKQLSGYAENICSATSELSGYCDYMPQIKDMMSNGFEPAQKFLESDFSIPYFLIGDWKTKSSSPYSLKFYINNEKIMCSSYLPYYDDGDYYDIINNVYSLYDSSNKKLHDVYQFTFEDVDTMKVYCYKDHSTYTLHRQKTIADCDSIFNEVSSLNSYSCEIANDGSHLYFYADKYGLGVGSATSYNASMINAELGLPDSLYEKMKNTRPIDGTQTETYSDLGLKVSWNYSSSNGLIVLYEII